MGRAAGVRRPALRLLRPRPQLHRRLLRGHVGPHHHRLDGADGPRPDGALDPLVARAAALARRHRDHRHGDGDPAPAAHRRDAAVPRRVLRSLREAVPPRDPAGERSRAGVCAADDPLRHGLSARRHERVRRRRSRDGDALDRRVLEPRRLVRLLPVAAARVARHAVHAGRRPALRAVRARGSRRHADPARPAGARVPRHRPDQLTGARGLAHGLPAICCSTTPSA